MKSAICASPTCDEVFEKVGKRITCSEVCKKAHEQQKYNLRRRERYARDPEYRKRESERHRKRWATNPEYRERENERNREWHRERLATDLEYREWKNERERERRADPEYRDRQNERRRDRWLKGRAFLKYLRRQGELQRSLSQKERRKLPGLYEKLVAGRLAAFDKTHQSILEELRRRAALLDQTNEPTPEDEKTDA